MRENRLSRDRQILVDFLNFDLSGYGKQKPSRWLAWFLERYNLNSAAGYETARQIQEEVREVLFLDTPDGKRELGPLVDEAREYRMETILVLSEDGRKIEAWPQEPDDPRKHIYGVIISAVDDESFWFLQDDCKNCHRIYWRKSDFCSLRCGREFNTKTAKDRMRRYRLMQKKRRGKK